jgi:hypothetical protein
MFERWWQINVTRQVSPQLHVNQSRLTWGGSFLAQTSFIWLLLYRLLFFFNIISWEQSPSHQKKKVGGRSVLALIRDQLTSGVLSSSVLYIFCPLDQKRLAFAGYACMGVMSDLKCANQVSQKLSIN